MAILRKARICKMNGYWYVFSPGPITSYGPEPYSISCGYVSFERALEFFNQLGTWSHLRRTTYPGNLKTAI